MKFYEALKALEEGKKIRCDEWDKNEYWDIKNLDVKIWNDCFYRIKLAILCNWEIYELPGLSFLDVIQGLKQGKQYRRKCWKQQACITYCPLTGDIKDYWGLYAKFTIDDLEAKDWISI